MVPEGGSTLSKMPEEVNMTSQPPGIRGTLVKYRHDRGALIWAPMARILASQPRVSGELDRGGGT